MARILVVSDDARGCGLLKEELEKVGHEVVVADASEFLDDALDLGSFEVVLVDLGRIARRLLQKVELAKKSHATVKFIALVGELSLSKASELAPFDDFVQASRLLELLVRLELALSKNRASQPVVRSAGLVVDEESYQAYLDGVPLELTFKEFELLRFFLANRGRVLSRQTILSHVWGYDYYGGTRTVDVHVRRLRWKINDPEGNLIQTVRNVGYRFRG